MISYFHLKNILQVSKPCRAATSVKTKIPKKQESRRDVTLKANT